MSEEKIVTTTKAKHSNTIDYKNVTSLRNHINPHARMNSRRRTGFKAKDQRDFARAIKRARFMALLPYLNY